MTYPVWLEIFLAICMGLAIAGLGAFLLYTFSIRLIKAALRLEDKRTNKETEALNVWKTAYDAEREDHVNDVAELTDRILTLEREAKIKNSLLAKVKVSEL
jgi:hypothetical protein